MTTLSDEEVRKFLQEQSEAFERGYEADRRTSELGRRARRWLAGYLLGDKPNESSASQVSAEIWACLERLIPGPEIVEDVDYQAGVADRIALGPMVNLPAVLDQWRRPASNATKDGK